MSLFLLLFLHQDNLHDLYNSAKIASGIGIDYFSIKPVFNWGGGANKDRIDPNNLTNDELEPIVANVKNDFENSSFAVFYRPFQIDSIKRYSAEELYQAEKIVMQK